MLDDPLCAINRFCNEKFLHSEPLPEPWNAKLDAFQKLLVLKCLRADKVTNAMQVRNTQTIWNRLVLVEFDFATFLMSNCFVFLVGFCIWKSWAAVHRTTGMLRVLQPSIGNQWPGYLLSEENSSHLFACGYCLCDCRSCMYRCDVKQISESSAGRRKLKHHFPYFTVERNVCFWTFLVSSSDRRLVPCVQRFLNQYSAHLCAVCWNGSRCWSL